MTKDELKKLAMELLDHYTNGRNDELIGLLTKDCEFRIGAGASAGIVPYHGVHQGHEQIRDYLTKRSHNSKRPPKAMGGNNCALRRPGTPAPEVDAPAPGSSTPGSHGRRQDHLLVDDDIVVAFGRLQDQFRDGSHMHETDFVLLFGIDQEQRKIRFFYYFLDTAAAMAAWHQRGAAISR